MSAPVNQLNISTNDACLERLREEERFAWFAGQVRSMIGRYSPTYLAELFERSPTWPGQREKVVVLLALDGSPEALCVLAGLDVKSYGSGLQMLHQVAMQKVIALPRNTATPTKINLQKLIGEELEGVDEEPDEASHAAPFDAIDRVRGKMVIAVAPGGEVRDDEARVEEGDMIAVAAFDGLEVDRELGCEGSSSKSGRGQIPGIRACDVDPSIAKASDHIEVDVDPGVVP